MGKREERAKKCANMMDGGFCSSFAEGVEDRMCPCLKPRDIFGDGCKVDWCIFNGAYGYHVKAK